MKRDDWQMRYDAAPEALKPLVDRAKERLEAGEERAAVRIDFNHEAPRITCG